MQQITAYSMARLVQYMKDFDCGTITAFRGFETSAIQRLGQTEFVKLLNSKDKEDKALLDSYRVTKAVNMKNLNVLARKLNVMGFTVIKITGFYREKGSPTVGKELSLFVVDSNNKGNLKQVLLQQGNLYAQDSITFAEAGKDFALYATSPFSDEPNKPLKKASGEKLLQFKGYSVGSVPEEAWSHLGNKPFYWKSVQLEEPDESTVIESGANYGYYQSTQIKSAFDILTKASGVWENDTYDKAIAEGKICDCECLRIEDLIKE